MKTLYLLVFSLGLLTARTEVATSVGPWDGEYFNCNKDEGYRMAYFKSLLAIMLSFGLLLSSGASEPFASESMLTAEEKKFFRVSQRFTHPFITATELDDTTAYTQKRNRKPQFLLNLYCQRKMVFILTNILAIT